MHSKRLKDAVDFSNVFVGGLFAQKMFRSTLGFTRTELNSIHKGWSLTFKILVISCIELTSSMSHPNRSTPDASISLMFLCPLSCLEQRTDKGPRLAPGGPKQTHVLLPSDQRVNVPHRLSACLWNDHEQDDASKLEYPFQKRLRFYGLYLVPFFLVRLSAEAKG